MDWGCRVWPGVRRCAGECSSLPTCLFSVPCLSHLKIGLAGEVNRQWFKSIAGRSEMWLPIERPSIHVAELRNERRRMDASRRAFGLPCRSSHPMLAQNQLLENADHQGRVLSKMRKARRPTCQPIIHIGEVRSLVRKKPASWAVHFSELTRYSRAL